MIIIKILISTSQNAINYGAVLQAYALGTCLKSMNVDYSMLNYYEKYNLYFSAFDTSTIRMMLISIYINTIKLVHIFSTHEQIKKFDQFVAERIPRTREYRTIEDLKKHPPIADLYMTGGDQMFNCHSGVSVQGFLNFGDENIKRYSYATSMGIQEPPKQYLEQFIECINRYEMVSLREESAKQFIAEHCNVKAQVNIDPVFLLDKLAWTDLIANQSRLYSKPYILVYQLLEHPLTALLVDELRKNSALDVVVLSPYSRNKIKGDKVIRNAGPIDFINLFAHAEKVITSSFHGTCFSLLFEKDFYSLIHEEREVRINNLLSRFKLTDRMLTSRSTIPSKEEHVDFSYSREIIELERKHSKKYLSQILGIDNE